MKYLYVCSLFFLLFFGFITKFNPKDQTIFASYNQEEEDSIRFEKYLASFEELYWIKDFFEIKQGLKFLEGIYEGNYLSYLELFFKKNSSNKLEYNEFLYLSERVKIMQKMTIFTKDEFFDVLLYGLIITKLVDTENFKNLAWLYQINTFLEAITIYPSIFPTLKRFNKEQILFLHHIVKNNELENLRGNISFLKENIECFDLSSLFSIYKRVQSYSTSN